MTVHFRTKEGALGLFISLIEMQLTAWKGFKGLLQQLLETNIHSRQNDKLSCFFSIPKHPLSSICIVHVSMFCTWHLLQILSSIYSLLCPLANALSLKGFLYFKSLSSYSSLLSRLSKPLQSLWRLTSYTILKILFNPPDQANTLFLKKVCRKPTAFI